MSCMYVRTYVLLFYVFLALSHKKKTTLAFKNEIHKTLFINIS